MKREEALTRARRTREACGHCDPGPCDQCAADAILKAVEESGHGRCGVCGEVLPNHFTGCTKKRPDRPQATGAPTALAGDIIEAWGGADDPGLTAEVVQAMLERANRAKPDRLSKHRTSVARVELLEQVRDDLPALARSWLAMRAAATKAATTLAFVHDVSNDNHWDIHSDSRGLASGAIDDALALLAAQDIKPEGT